jgi:ribosomal protein S18 acetylase RimI-like enzyme
VGYVCFGPTPMTDGTFDLYWIATDPSVRGKGVGTSLVTAMETELRGRGARMVRVETSATDAYGATRDFYTRARYAEEARLRDFYKPGDDLVILAKRLG